MNTIWTIRAKCDNSEDAPESDTTNENDMMNNHKENKIANDTNLSNNSNLLYSNSPFQLRPKLRFLIYVRGLLPLQSLL